MGWFWANDQKPRTPLVAHPLPAPNGSPPPACPMHKSTSVSFPPQNTPSPPSDGSCPVKSPNAPLPSSKPQPSYVSKLNPLNYMPSNLSQSRAENQTIHLPTEREMSSIPRGDAQSNWEYPSPQQMYNAMLRKGYDDTPQDAVESMVAVHNFLNEGAWAEIVGWEQRFSRGLAYGWHACSRGEDGFEEQVSQKERFLDPKLLRFQGRPSDVTPKARMLEWLGWLYPARYGGEPPFDRHDWYVERQLPQGQKREVRYVIDYYAGPPEPTGEPVFYLDVRPAVDGPTAAVERMMRWGGDVWYRASGAKVREQPEV